MKLVTYESPGSGPRLGALVDADQRVAGLSDTGDQRLASMQALIEAGPEGLVAARAGADGPSVPLQEARLLAPVPVPVQMRDCLCFEEHVRRSLDALKRISASQADDPVAALAALEGDPRYVVPAMYWELPVYYKTNRFSCVGTGADVRWPAYSERMDYELELGCWIGRGGSDIAEADAAQHVFGYSVFNDMSARDAQWQEMGGQLGPAKGKDFDTGNVIGPCIVTADAIDATNLVMIARVNGEEVSRGSSATMTWSFPQVIARVSASETLHPGEFLGSGTVGGGSGLERMSFLADGDVVELEIEGIGVLSNRIVRA